MPAQKRPSPGYPFQLRTRSFVARLRGFHFYPFCEMPPRQLFCYKRNGPIDISTIFLIEISIGQEHRSSRKTMDAIPHFRGYAIKTDRSTFGPNPKRHASSFAINIPPCGDHLRHHRQRSGGHWHQGGHQLCDRVHEDPARSEGSSDEPERTRTFLRWLCYDPIFRRCQLTT